MQNAKIAWSQTQKSKDNIIKRRTKTVQKYIKARIERQIRCGYSSVEIDLECFELTMIASYPGVMEAIKQWLTDLNYKWEDVKITKTICSDGTYITHPGIKISWEAII